MLDRRIKCRSCDKMAALEEDEYNRITEYYLDLENVKGNLASREVSRKRMEICSGCAHLVGGVSCRFCSCLVPVMVRLENKKCPCPAGALW